jgi:hypothetical protein
MQVDQAGNGLTLDQPTKIHIRRNVHKILLILHNLLMVFILCA